MIGKSIITAPPLQTAACTYQWVLPAQKPTTSFYNFNKISISSQTHFKHHRLRKTSV